MECLKKYIVSISLLELLILISGNIIVTQSEFGISSGELLFLSGLFFVNNSLILYIFFRGQTREADSQTMHSLVAVSLKFLVELVIALVWFIIAKKTEMPDVVLFFVLYLTFTLFSVWLILKTLKYKSL